MDTVLGNVHAALRPFWHPVAWCDEIHPSMAVTLLDQPLLIVRDSAGAIHAFDDECPHRGAPISMGTCVADELVCAFHGWRFGMDGAATLIPSLGPTAALPSRARLGRPADVCERYGLVWVALEPPLAPIPVWPDGDDATLGAFSPTAHTSHVLAAYQTDNLLDASHFGFLHPSLAGRNPVLTHHEVVRQDEFGFTTALRKLGDDDATTEGWLRYTLAAPYTVLLRSEEADGTLRQSFFQAVQPIDQQRTRLFFLVRVLTTDADELSELAAAEEQVQREDLWITAAQRRTGMAVSEGPDLHVRSDRNAVLYRQTLRNVLRAHRSAD
jgi:phenylpropionate dioxygenase-like ring-hydroxylating dioxygenase large terminal subunit